MTSKCTTGLAIGFLSVLVVGLPDRRSGGLDGVAGVCSLTAEVGAVVRVGDVRPPEAVGVDAEVVEQLAAGFAHDAFLADAALVHGHQPLRFAPTGWRAAEVLNEPHVVGLVLFRRAVVDEVDPAGGGGEPGEDRLGRAAADRFGAAPALAVVA